MNMRYGNVDGKIVVSDENGNLTYQQDSSYLEEILISENLIEMMEKEVRGLEALVQVYNMEVKDKFLKRLLKRLPLYLATATLAGLFCMSFEFFLLSYLVVIFMSLLEEWSNQSKQDKKARENEGYEYQLRYLYQCLNLEKGHLKSLKNLANLKGSKDEKTLISTKLVQDKKRLQQIKRELSLAYEKGYDKENNREESTKQYQKTFE